MQSYCEDSEESRDKIRKLENKFKRIISNSWNCDDEQKLQSKADKAIQANA